MAIGGNKDFSGIIQAVYDPTSNALNVNVQGSGTPTMPNVVRLTDGTNYLTTSAISGKTALDVSIANMPEILINQSTDSIAIGDGTNLITSTSLGGKQALDVNVLSGGALADNITLIDSTVAGTTYIGSAVPTSSPSAAVWQILKIVSSSGNTSVLYAGGSDSFTNVWNNRTALAYS
jgi:hypothetical protein